MKENDRENLKKAMDEMLDESERNQAYNKYVKNVTPVNNVIMNLFRAFFVGGLICLIAQIITNVLMDKCGLNYEDANSYQILILVLSSVILTGTGLYSKLTKFAGAGAVVPITGFANSVSSAAIEYKKEGQVFGIGCKIFSIAGPVILYGIFSSWLLGLIYWVISLF